MSGHKDIAVRVENLTKSFRIPLEAHSGLKQKLINTLKGRKGYREFSPLNDISFTIEKGDFFGIVGRNGSGKSTLLKTIAGIYNPTKGSVGVDGKLVPFIELGVGFNPELTGRENVFLNGALLGFSRGEMEDMYEEIVDFAELHDFMDERLKNYSSGMQVRLAFSIAIRAQGDILLLDEVLAVGDAAFQQKCFKYFKQLKDSKKTVILVTHDMNAVREYCNKALLLDAGKIIKSGNAIEISRSYAKLFEQPEPDQEPDNRWGDKRIEITEIDKVTYDTDIISLGIRVKSHTDTNSNIKLSYKIKDQDGRILFGSESDDPVLSKMKSGEIAYCKISVNNILSDGEYHLDVSVYDVLQQVSCDAWLDCAMFMIKLGRANKYGLLVEDSFQSQLIVE